ncbi:MAG: hypothetical protein C0482_21950 [Gordonia sp.]|nr:hypothetical protein [Gordonia sp. (in: high G+C Gram-positive bacteria)]
MTWNGLNRIHNVPGMGDDDESLIAELQEVLVRHGAQHRIGITLLHSHFDLKEDEVLIERVDADNKRLTITAEKASDFEADQLLPTMWRLDTPSRQALQYCWRPRNSPYHAI